MLVSVIVLAALSSVVVVWRGATEWVVGAGHLLHLAAIFLDFYS